MARPDRYRDDDDHGPPALRFSSPVVIIALVVGGVLALGCLLFGGMAVLWSTVESDKSRPAAQGKAEAGKTYTREQFKTAFVGKSKDEVLAVLGRPESTNEAGGTEYWNYPRVTVDPVSG